MHYSLERFEDTFAVLQNDAEETVIVDRSLLPPDAKAGEVFCLYDGRYERDADETTARKTRISRLQELLRKGKR